MCSVVFSCTVSVLAQSGNSRTFSSFANKSLRGNKVDIFKTSRIWILAHYSMLQVRESKDLPHSYFLGEITLFDRREFCAQVSICCTLAELLLTNLGSLINSVPYLKWMIMVNKWHWALWILSLSLCSFWWNGSKDSKFMKCLWGSSGIRT